MDENLLHKMSHEQGQIHAKVDLILEKQDSINKRVNDLEKTKWFGHGVVVGIGALISYIWRGH